MVLREHQFITLILSLRDSVSSSKAKLAPPASSTHTLACKPPRSGLRWTYPTVEFSAPACNPTNVVPQLLSHTASVP